MLFYMKCSFFFNDTATTEIYTLSLHDALPICQRWHVELIGQEHKCFPRIGIIEANTTQMFWVMLLCIETIQRNGLIAYQARGPVHRRGIDPVCMHILLRASDKEAGALMQSEQALEIDVSPIHNV